MIYDPISMQWLSNFSKRRGGRLVPSGRLRHVPLHVTKSYTYLGHIITDNLCDEADIKAKVGCLYGRSNILLRKFYFCSERVKNRLFSSYCSNLYLCSVWANYRKSSISRFIVSYNNSFRILHNLHMRCSASSMFANAVVDNCSTCIRKSIFSLMMRLNTSINVIVQSTLKSIIPKTGQCVIHLMPIFFLFTMDRMYFVPSRLK